jgi:hypothetical protein
MERELRLDPLKSFLGPVTSKLGLYKMLTLNVNNEVHHGEFPCQESRHILRIG